MLYLLCYLGCCCRLALWVTTAEANEANVKADGVDKLTPATGHNGALMRCFEPIS